MPRGDKTGPQGQGPKTGRGQRKCGPKGGTPAPQEQGGVGSGRRGGQGRGQGAGQGGHQGAGKSGGRKR